MDVDLNEFRAAYLAEVDEHLAGVNAALVSGEAALRDARPIPRELRELMRLLHTVKGLSAMVGVEPIVTIAHHMENVVRVASASSGVLGEAAFEALVAGTRAIEARVRTLGSGGVVTEPPPDLIELLDAADRATPGEADAPPSFVLDDELSAKLTAAERDLLARASDDNRRAVRIDFAPSPAKAEGGHTITSVRERLSALGEIIRVVPLARERNAENPGGLVFAVLLFTGAADAAIAEAAAAEPSDVREIVAARRLPASTRQSAPPPGAADAAGGGASELDGDDAGTPAQRSSVLRVEVSRIDDAIEKLSALIVTRSRMTRAIAALRESGVATRELEAIAHDNARQLRDLRAAILSVRMVPIESILDRLPLVVRGLGRSTGKQVRLVALGGGAELDKTVAERVFPALVHLIRNAVDHGIETPEARARAGKADLATITVAAASRSNRQIEIRVEDDGGGIDRARVAAKAGRDVPTDERSLLDLLCRPGLSTRDAADTTSGRGMGMDIVKKVVVDGLGGDLVLESTGPHGTAFVLKLPLTISIVDAFVVQTDRERYVVPVGVVEEIVEVEASRIVEGPRGLRQTRFFTRRGETIPLVDLASVLGGGAGTRMTRSAEHGEATNETNASSMASIALVVRRGHDEPVAFLTDRVLGQQETVVRPLVDPLVSVAGVSGTTDLGDGRATLVLDLLGLGARLLAGRDGRRSVAEHGGTAA